METKQRKVKRFYRECRIGRVLLEFSRHINRQCLSFGITVNWNYRPSVEMDIGLWRLYIELTRPCWKNRFDRQPSPVSNLPAERL